MNTKNRGEQWLWYFSIFAAAIVLYQVGGLNVFAKFAPVLAGFALAFLLYRPCKWIEDQFLLLKHRVWHKLARPLALVITYLLFLGLVTLLFYMVIPVLVESLSKLIGDIPNLLANSRDTVDAWFAEDGPLGGWDLQEHVDAIYAFLTNTFTKLITVENLMAAIKSLTDVASFLIDAIISLVVSVYMLHGRDHLFRALRNFLSLFMRPRSLARLRQYTRRSGGIFSQYIFGALLDALLVGSVVSIGLLIFRVPYAVLLGMTLGLLNLIPYFGAIVGCMIIAFVALLTNGLPTAIGVIIYIVVVQQVDANIIQPRIVGDSVGLRPFYVLLSIIFFGGLFGFWGILLGPPLMAVLQMIVRDCYARRHKNKALIAEEADEE